METMSRLAWLECEYFAHTEATHTGQAKSPMIIIRNPKFSKTQCNPNTTLVREETFFGTKTSVFSIPSFQPHPKNSEGWQMGALNIDDAKSISRHERGVWATVIG
jgi:hypothetical protein